MAKPTGTGVDTQTCRSLYVGNLTPQINETLLYEIFASVGQVEHVKIIRDKATSTSLGYGFVDFVDHETAGLALAQLNGCNVYGSEVKLNWAVAGAQKEDTSGHFHIFVGDLSPEIDDNTLREAFQAFGALTDARVMWDQTTGRSRGYGFVAFKQQADAEQAIQDMNGQWLGTRSIRVNWANQKTNTPKAAPASGLDYNTVYYQASATVTTVYVGNMGPEISEADLRATFAQYGVIEEVKTYYDKGYGFVRYQNHESAARAIVGAHGLQVNGRQIRCAWGKDKQQQQQQQQHQHQQQTQQASAFPVWPFGFPPMPGMPVPPFGMSPYFMPPMYPPGAAAWGSWPTSPQGNSDGSQ